MGPGYKILSSSPSDQFLQQEFTPTPRIFQNLPQTVQQSEYQVFKHMTLKILSQLILLSSNYLQPETVYSGGRLNKHILHKSQKIPVISHTHKIPPSLWLYKQQGLMRRQNFNFLTCQAACKLYL